MTNGGGKGHGKEDEKKGAEQGTKDPKASQK